MKKLVVAIIAMLAMFTFIREYKAPTDTGTQQARIEISVPAK